MSDKKRLKDTLLKLASEISPVEDGWRRIEGENEAGPLAAVLAEIDETLLPRALGLRSEGGDILLLEVGDRRLRRLVSPAPAGLSAFGQLFDGSLSVPSDDTIDSIGEMFRAFLSGGKPVWVRAKNLSDNAEHGLIGVSAATLARAWSVELTARPEIEPGAAFEEFVEAAVARSEAWLRSDGGEVVATSDPHAHAAWLENCGSVDWQSYFAAHRGHALVKDAPTLCVLGTEAAPNTHLMMAAYGPVHFVALVSSSSLPDITGRWRQLGL